MTVQNGGGLGDVVIHAAGAAGYDALIYHELAVYQLIGQVQSGLAAELGLGALFHLAQMIARIVDKLAQRHGLGRVERQRGHRLHAAEVDGDHAVVVRAVLRIQRGKRLRPAVDGKVLRHGVVGLPYGAEAGGFRGHNVDADAIVHGQLRYGRACKLQHLVLYEAVFVHRTAQRDGHVVRPYALGRLPGEPDQDHLRSGNIICVAQQLLYDLGSALADAHGAERAVARVAVGAEYHAAAAAHHLSRVLVDDRLIGRHIISAVFHGGGQAEHMVVLVYCAADSAQAVVAVGQHIWHRKLRHAAGFGGLDDSHIGDIMGNETVECQVHRSVAAGSVMAAEDLISHGLVPAGRKDGFGGRRHAALQGDAFVLKLNHMVTLLLGEIL